MTLHANLELKQTSTAAWTPGEFEMTTQPEALRLADELEKDPLVNRLGFVLVAAKYLRRLHYENEALRKPAQQALNIQPPNYAGETVCIVRWVAETPSGWVGSYYKSALEQFAAPQPVQERKTINWLSADEVSQIAISHSPNVHRFADAIELAVLKKNKLL